MFYYLDGTVAEILPYLAVIDCGGVGYACKTTNTTLAQLKKGQRGKLYTYLDVGENAFGLYGFATANELNSFKLLIGVSGVGPKAALAILSAATPESLAMAIVTGDEKSLTAAPGVGKKIAQRIILELKDKMARESAATGLDFSGGAAVSVPAFTNKATEAAQALAVLGYTSAEVAQALKGVDVENGAHIPFAQIDRLVEDDQYFYIFQSRQMAVMIPKGSLLPANPERFAKVLAKETGRDWQRSKSLWGLNLKDLIQMGKDCFQRSAS